MGGRSIVDQGAPIMTVSFLHHTFVRHWTGIVQDPDLGGRSTLKVNAPTSHRCQAQASGGIDIAANMLSGTLLWSVDRASGEERILYTY